MVFSFFSRKPPPAFAPINDNANSGAASNSNPMPPPPTTSNSQPSVTQLRTPSPSVDSSSIGKPGSPSAFRTSEAPPRPVPSPTPELITDPTPLHTLISSIPPQTLHTYTLAHLNPSLPPPDPTTLTALSSFFAELTLPPRLHCVRCHKGYFDVENNDRSCLVPHDDDSAEVERVGVSGGRSRGLGTEYQTLWGCCGKVVEGDGDMGPPDGWCYEGKHTTDTKRARFRDDSSLEDDKLVSCSTLRCHDTLPVRATRKRTHALVDTSTDDEDSDGSIPPKVRARKKAKSASLRASVESDSVGSVGKGKDEGEDEEMYADVTHVPFPSSSTTKPPKSPPKKRKSPNNGSSSSDKPLRSKPAPKPKSKPPQSISAVHTRSPLSKSSFTAPLQEPNPTSAVSSPLSTLSSLPASPQVPAQKMRGSISPTRGTRKMVVEIIRKSPPKSQSQPHEEQTSQANEATSSSKSQGKPISTASSTTTKHKLPTELRRLLSTPEWKTAHVRSGSAGAEDLLLDDPTALLLLSEEEEGGRGRGKVTRARSRSRSVGTEGSGVGAGLRGLVERERGRERREGTPSPAPAAAISEKKKAALSRKGLPASWRPPSAAAGPSVSVDSFTDATAAAAVKGKKMKEGKSTVAAAVPKSSNGKSSSESGLKRKSTSDSLLDEGGGGGGDGARTKVKKQKTGKSTVAARQLVDVVDTSVDGERMFGIAR